jgi:hypothetical protein
MKRDTVRVKNPCFFLSKISNHRQASCDVSIYVMFFSIINKVRYKWFSFKKVKDTNQLNHRRLHQINVFLSCHFFSYSYS